MTYCEVWRPLCYTNLHSLFASMLRSYINDTDADTFGTQQLGGPHKIREEQSTLPDSIRSLISGLFRGQVYYSRYVPVQMPTVCKYSTI